MEVSPAEPEVQTVNQPVGAKTAKPVETTYDKVRPNKWKIRESGIFYTK